MRFLQKFGFRLQWTFLVLCWTCVYASIKLNDNWLTMAALVFASISILGYCIESSANAVIKEAQKESLIIRETLNKFLEKDEEKQ